MNRRNFLKCLGAAVVAPVALLKSKSKPKAGIDCSRPVKWKSEYFEDKTRITTYSDNEDEIGVWVDIQYTMFCNNKRRSGFMIHKGVIKRKISYGMLKLY